MMLVVIIFSASSNSSQPLLREQELRMMGTPQRVLIQRGFLPSIVVKTPLRGPLVFTTYSQIIIICKGFAASKDECWKSVVASLRKLSAYIHMLVFLAMKL